MSTKLGIVGDSIPLFANNGYISAGDVLVQHLAWLGAGDSAVTLTNAAVSATATADWLPGGSRYTTARTALAAAGVNLVVLALGANDARTATSVISYVSRLAAIANALASDLAATVLIVKPYGFDTTRSAGVDAGYTAANLTLQRSYLAPMSTLDNGTTVRVGTDGLATFIAKSPALLSDGVHPDGPHGINAVGWHWMQDALLRCPALVDFGAPRLTVSLASLRRDAGEYDTTDPSQKVTVAILGGY